MVVFVLVVIMVVGVMMVMVVLMSDASDGVFVNDVVCYRVFGVMVVGLL